jgi:hypothetical protein
MKDRDCTLITLETRLRDALDVIDKAGSRIAIVVDAGRYLFDQLMAGCTAPLSYSSRALFQSPSRVVSRLVKLFSSSFLNSLILYNHLINKS